MFSTKISYFILFLSISLISSSKAEQDFSLPFLKKGIWAIKHTQEIKGQQVQFSPERLTTWCLDPMVKIREDITSIQNNKCSIKFEPNSTKEEFIYSATCELRPGGSKKIQISIKSTNPNNFQVINLSEEAKSILEGNFVREC